MLPLGYTQHPEVSDKARHRLLANGWHIGAARFMMILVIAAAASVTSASPSPSVSRSALQQLAEPSNTFPASLGPGSWDNEPNATAPASSMWEHWRSSFFAQHHLQRDPTVEPGLQQCIALQQAWASRLPSLRAQAVEEIQQWVQDQQAETLTWWRNLPGHIRPVYQDPESHYLTQIPIFVELLRMFHYTDVDTIASELQYGFPIAGKMNKGVGWLPRCDQRYEFPLSPEAFRQHNRSYVQQKVKSKKVDKHWQDMLRELEDELSRGRMSGPYRQPSWWPGETVGLPHRPLLELEDDDIKVSFLLLLRSPAGQDTQMRRSQEIGA